MKKSVVVERNVRTRLARVRGNSARKRAAKRLRRDVSRNAHRVISLTSLKDNRGYSSSVIQLPKHPVSPSQRPFTRALLISGSREKMVGCKQPPSDVHDKRNIPGIFSFFRVANLFGKWKRPARRWRRTSRGIRTAGEVTEIEMKNTQ